MAKTTIEAEVRLDDKGNLKKTAASADKTAAALDRVGTSARTTDRRIKGVANSSSSSTKNFSKMAQGMGGVVVPAYAAFAAQMFALTAGFQFLKRAGDLKVLQAGQLAYASTTGIAMKSLALSIQAATNAQIDFREASTAAAIGTAAGLTPDQLERLGKAAVGVSVALGRDVTDSFNRLIRGVTKAEPELLDELGIILRLERANKNYADALGVAKDSLNAFQRSQAVTIDTLKQAEDKYGDLAEILGEDSANSFSQLGVVLSEMADTLSIALLPAAESIARVFRDIPLLAAASFGLLLSGPLSAIGFSLKDLSASSRELSKELNENYKSMSTGSKNVTNQLKSKKKEIQNISRTILSSPEYTGQSKLLKSISDGGEVSKFQQSGLKTALRSAETQLKTHATVQKGIFVGMSKTTVATYRGMLTQLSNLEKQKMASTQATTSWIKKQWTGLAATITGTFAALGTAVGRVFNILGYLGIAYTIYEVIKSFVFPEKELNEKEKADKSQIERIHTLNKEYSRSLEIQTKVFNKSKEESDLRRAQLNFLRQAQTISFDDLIVMRQKTNELRLQQQLNRDSQGSADMKGNLYGVGAAVGTIGAVAGAMMLFPPTTIMGSITAGILSVIAAMGAYKVTYNQFAGDSRGISEAMKKDGEALEQLQTRMKGLLKQMKDFRNKIEAGGAQYEGFDRFAEIINNGNPSGNNRGEFNDLQERFQRLELIINSSNRAFTEGKAAIRDFYTELFKPSTAETNLAKVAAARDGVLEKARFRKSSKNATGNDKGMNASRAELEKRLTNGERRGLADLDRDFKIMEDFLKVEVASTREISRLTHLKNKNTINIFESTRKILDSAVDLQIHEEQQILNRRKLLELENQMERAGEKVLESDIRARDNLKTKIENTEELLEIERMRHAVNEMMLEVSQGIEAAQASTKFVQSQKIVLGVRQQLLSVEKESLRLKKAAADRKITQTLQDEKRSNPFAFLNAEERSTQLRLKAEKEHLEDVKKQEEANYANRIKAIEFDFKLKRLEMRILERKLRKEAVQPDFARLSEGEQQEHAALIEEIRTDILGPTGILAQTEQKSIDVAEKIKTDAIDNQKATVKALEVALENMGIVQESAIKLAESLQSNLSTALFDFISGTISAKDAFKQFAVSVIQDMARIASQKLASQILGGLATGLGSLFGATPEARHGGVMSKKIGYATGGIARGTTAGYPAILHGNEAVVPLPDGKSIPVDMTPRGGKGSAFAEGPAVNTTNTSNNVTVNVSSDGSTTTERQGGSPDMDMLGKAVARVVQQELHTQQRSGGLLNPYGAT